MGVTIDKPRRQIRVFLQAAPETDRNLKRILLEHDIVHSAGPKDADVVIADLRAGEAEKLDSTVARLRDSAPSTPLILFLEPGQMTGPDIRELVGRETTVVSVRQERALINEIIRQALVADRAAEAAVRVKTMSAIGLGDLPPSPERGDPTALLVAPPAPLTLDLSSRLSHHTNLRTVMSRSQALTMLELGAADRVFILPDVNRRPMAAMIKLLRRHSELSAVPVIVLERQPSDRHRDYWSRAGADIVLPASEDMLAAAIADQRRHERNAHQSAMKFLRHASFTEIGEQSRLCAPRFFEAALDLRCRSEMTFSLGALRLKPHGSGDRPHIFTEPAIYVALGMQPADLVTRAAPDLLLMSFAGADQRHARHSMSLLSTLIGDLKFGTQSHPVTFATRTNVIAAPTDSDPRQLIRQVIRGLNTTPPVDALFA